MEADHVNPKANTGQKPLEIDLVEKDQSFVRLDLCVTGQGCGLIWTLHGNDFSTWLAS
jgi:hypothetical protein